MPIRIEPGPDGELVRTVTPARTGVVVSFNEKTGGSYFSPWFDLPVSWRVNEHGDLTVYRPCSFDPHDSDTTPLASYAAGTWCSVALHEEEKP